MSVFENKRVIAIGERDGISGPAIGACIEAGGGDLAYSYTACFV